MFRVMGKVALKEMGREARKVLRVEEAMGMAMGMAWEAMEMASGAEEMEMGETGEDRLRWPITTLLSFSLHGTPRRQIRLRIISSRKLLNAIQLRMQFAAMMKINLRLQAAFGQLTNQVAQAQGQVAAVNVLARQAQGAAHGAANVDRFRPATPPKYGDKKKGEHVGHWIPVIEDYLRSASNADYIRLASSYLEGGPRTLWTNVYEAFKKGNGGNEPPNPRHFFRETLEANYGLQDLDQKYLDTWNSLRMGPSQSVTEYNVDFQQALTDLAGHVTDEQVKIEKYRAGLQHDLRQLCRTSQLAPVGRG
jgi:hypothetical protein